MSGIVSYVGHDRTRVERGAVRGDGGGASAVRSAEADALIAEFEDSGLRFDRALRQSRMAVCVTNPRLPDNPIVFVNAAFLELTGYALRDVLGRNCRFLQGPQTDRAHVEKLREAVRAEKSVVVELLNYRRDGTPFWNALHVGPIRDASGRLIYYFGSQWDVTEVHEARGGDLPRVNALARAMTGRLRATFTTLASTLSRTTSGDDAHLADQLSAVGRAYNSSVLAAADGRVDLAEVVGHVLAAEGLSAVEVDGPRAFLPETSLSLVALCLHELARAARGAAARGGVRVGWTPPNADELTLVWMGATGAEAHAALHGLLERMGGGVATERGAARLRIPLGTGR